MALFHRLRKADNIQPPNDPVVAAAEYADAAIAADLQQAFAELGKQIDPEALKRAIAARNLTAILDLVPREQLTEDLAAALTRLVEVAQQTAQLASKELEDRTVMRIAFDPLAPTFTQLMVDMRTNLVQGMTSDAQAALQAIIVDGYQRGIGVDAIARNIRDMISLGEQRAQAVLNYRRALEEGSGRALTYDLRDSRFDGTVSRALDGVADIPADKIDRMVARYAERQLASRAKTIARTEALRAANIGQRAGYQQFIDKGLVDKDGITIRWLVAMDEATCEICQSIPDMNPEGVGWGEDFDSIDGPVSMPPDPHPNCRCSLTYHIAANAISKGYNPDQPRDERGRWEGDGTIWHHGSPNAFTQFDQSKTGTTTDAGWLGRGTYFSTDPNVSAPSLHRYEAELGVKSTLELKLPDFRTDKRDIVRAALGLPKSATADEITAAARSKGYDSISLDYSPTGYNHREIVVFDTSSIKSVRMTKQGNDMT